MSKSTILKFTESAKDKVHSFIEASGKKEIALRVKVKEKNEKGFLYSFQLDDSEMPNDTVLHEYGFTTRLDPSSLLWMKGSTIDWLLKDGKEGFAVVNPNAYLEFNQPSDLKDKIIESIQTIFDPEIPVNIYDLGLIYGIYIDDEKNVKVQMTLTTPNCPAAEQLPQDVKNKVAEVPTVQSVDLELTWEPPWDKSMMTDAARLQLNIS